MEISQIIQADETYCVYAHRVNGMVFYVGSGVLPRAFECGSTRRNEAWNEFFRQQGQSAADVIILYRCRERSEGRRVEYDFIKKLRPIANLPWGADCALEWQVLETDGFQVATDAYTGWYIEAEPGGLTFSSIKAASKLLGISPSAISNSITGRYPEVKGYRFKRVAPPSRFVTPAPPYQLKI